MPAVGAPRHGVARIAGEDENEAAPAGERADPLEQRAPLGGDAFPFAEEHAAPARQSGERGPERVALTRIGDQPDARKGVEPSHRRPYSAAMPPPATAPDATAPAERLAAIRAGIARAASSARRDPAGVTLIAVSKTHGPDEIAPLIAAGQRVFGENRVQEARAKWPALREATAGIALHLVGQLQSNKAADAVALFDAIHSVDRPSLVAALGRAIERGRRPDCFVQVAIGDEPRKGGCALADLPALLRECGQATLPVAGLMCVPPAGREPAPYFALLAKLARDHGLPGLSMGMSDDYGTAVLLGATHVRVGSALFGGRAPLA